MTAKETSRGRRGLAPLELVLALPILLFVSGLISPRSRFLLRRLQNPMGRNFLWKSPRSPN